MAYHHFYPETETGSFETFEVSPGSRLISPGWYWQACFPGCLPDSDPMGPFSSEAEAIENARETC